MPPLIPPKLLVFLTILLFWNTFSSRCLTRDAPIGGITIRKATTMSSSTGGVGLLGLRGWRVSFVLFLAFLVPVSPLLAEIQNDTASRDTAQAAASTTSAISSQHHVSSYFVALDLLGQGGLLHSSPAMFVPVGGTSTCDVGRHDADQETDGTLWFFLGLLLTIWGPILAYIITPSVPETKLTGKNDNYVAAYSVCYQEVAKSIHVKWAWYGLGAFFVGGMLAALILLVAGGGKMSN